MLSRLLRANLNLTLKPKLTLTSNLVTKRWSGHNAMNIEPTNYDWKRTKDIVHFYAFISIVPLAVITTIINIRANPELTEIPEGYEPRHWEYFKHPIARFMARYMFTPMELEHELQMAQLQNESEGLLVRKIQKNVERTMKFYNDHRSQYFKPVYAEWWRIGRDNVERGNSLMKSCENVYYEEAYKPDSTPVPTEGYVPKDSD